MTWLLATTPTTTRVCGRCRELIGQGEAYAELAGGRLLRCTTCMEHTFGAVPPDAVWSGTPVTDALPTPVREGLTTLAEAQASVLAALPDVRARQLAPGDR